MSKYRFRVLFCIAAGMLTACQNADVSDSRADPISASTPMLWLSANSESQPWEGFVTGAINDYGASLVNSNPEDIGDWCPAYEHQSSEQRRAFWAFLMSSLMKYESNYDPSVTYTEPFEDASGNSVISRGLLQLSIESSNGYGCGIVDANELHDPKDNLSCSIRIMDRWIGRDNVIESRTTTGEWRGMARYWSPFRRSQQRGAMQAQVSASSYCQS
ncbi:hypothetical protein EOK75_11455 [Pseudorhodobacter turbinis]|uniref:Transglycosylase SLT domain-containing protein n=1 Tax=Pseudorhodobacter turbinis TaxID=2500533 RepID=A0A4P8EGK5_9RHOB|nr:hypothetical protein [Pseudorhodobacter turbinis]QCO56291.1 hypothetical protein EOK75_11455 [Pseudorhodobacter turbinis]